MRLKNGTVFTVVLLGSIALITYLVWISLVYFCHLWNWPVTDLRSTIRGYRPQSIFQFFSLIPGFFGGLFVTESIRRGYKNGGGVSMFLVPYLTMMAAMIEMRLFDLYEMRPISSGYLHGALLGLWFVNLVIYFNLRKRFKASGK